jgi:teichuronic acid biosynthesis glycosyltransferase TuaC
MTGVIWVTNDYPWEGDPVGGIFFQTQARAVARLGVAITVVAPTPVVPWPLARLSPRWRRYAASPPEMRDENVIVARPRYLNVPGQPDWALPDRAMASAAWRSRRHWDGASAIHGHYAVAGLAAWRLARKTGLPFFLTFHGDDMNTWPDEHPDRRADLRAAVSEARGVFTVSGALARRVRDVTGTDAIPLPIGSDHRSIDLDSLPRAEARRLLGLREDRVVVLFVGYLQREKGVRELARAVLELGDPFTCAFVGDGPELGYGADDPRSQGCLLYQGARSHADVIRHMCAADVLVLPSYGEGLPTVIVEAGSTGLPVIASAVGGIPELLGQDRGTLLPETSTEAVARALMAFAANREEARLAGRRLRDHVRAEYDVDANARRLLDHYRAAGVTADMATGDVS